MMRSILLIAAIAAIATPAAAADTKRLSFSTDFREPVTPDGGPGKWMSRFDWGRYQSGNAELAPYTDATTDPGVTPHPVVGDRRVLRAELKPTREGGRTFAFSASMMSTQRWRSFRYGYFQLTVTVCPETGVVPAFWLLPRDGGWPPEIDVFEFGLVPGEPAGQLRTNVHLKGAQGQHVQDSHKPPFVADCREHVYGFNWTRDVMEWRVDGTLVDARRNTVDQPMYVIVNTAVGLMSSGPAWTKADWHNDMTLTSLKVWQEPADITSGW